MIEKKHTMDKAAAMPPEATGARGALRATGVKTARIGLRRAGGAIAEYRRKIPVLQRTRGTRAKSKNEQTEANSLPSAC